MLRKKTLFGAIVACACAIITGFCFLKMPQTITSVNAEPTTIERTELFDSANATYGENSVKIAGVGKINGVFKDSASIAYGVEGSQTNMAITICSTDGEEIVTIVRANNYANWRISLYAYYNGMYSWNESGAMNTSTTKWSDASVLPSGDNYNTQVNTVMLTVTGNTFTIQHTLVNNNVWTIAEFALTESHAAALAQGFTIGFRTLDSNKASDVVGAGFNATGYIEMTAINEVSVANVSVAVDASTTVY